MKKLYNITVGRIIPDIPDPNEEDWTTSLAFGTNKLSNIKDSPSPILHSSALAIVARCAPTIGGYQNIVGPRLHNLPSSYIDITMSEVYITYPEEKCISLSNFRIDHNNLLCDIECINDDVFNAISTNPVSTLRLRSICVIDSVTNRPTEQEIITWDFLNE